MRLQRTITSMVQRPDCVYAASVHVAPQRAGSTVSPLAGRAAGRNLPSLRRRTAGRPVAVRVRTDPDRHHGVRPPSVELAEADDRLTSLNGRNATLLQVTPAVHDRCRTRVSLGNATTETWFRPAPTTIRQASPEGNIRRLSLRQKTRVKVAASTQKPCPSPVRFSDAAHVDLHR